MTVRELAAALTVLPERLQGYEVVYADGLEHRDVALRAIVMPERGAGCEVVILMRDTPPAWRLLEIIAHPRIDGPGAGKDLPRGPVGGGGPYDKGTKKGG